ncbi:uncharacterized protein C17orf113-like [Saccostrea echinata]|uniref:uncharacterized protein C17orf113-like n=1 Tax=Saccostrea echinata TaxID=191078 RepID=UPI002A82BA34|nr:uncharacterized protein C17orf113-like [Saccostrea echinata]
MADRRNLEVSESYKMKMQWNLLERSLPKKLHKMHLNAQLHLTAITKSKLAKQQPLQKLLASKLDKDEQERQLETLETRFLCNIEISTPKADAETIVNHVITELRVKGLDVSKLVGVGTDGASVMTGRKNGVIVRLKEYSPALVGIHCAAHRCALAASQASKCIPQLKKYSDTVANIFFYFSGSALRSNKLREIQMLLNLPTLKFAQIHSVRWLSLQKSVEILYRTYPALLIALEHEGTTNPAARGIHAEVSQYNFIAITHMLMDILPFLGRLSRIFQTKDLDLSKLRPIVESTCEALLDFKEAQGIYVDKLEEFITIDGDEVTYNRPDSESKKSVVQEAIDTNIDGFDGFESSDEEIEAGHDGVQVRFFSQQKNILRSIMPQYVDNIVKNLKDRFQESGLIEKMQVLQPLHITSAHKKGELAKFGNESVAVLAEHFAIQGIETEQVPMEYKQCKRLVIGSFSTSSLSEVCEKLGSEYEDILPNLIKLVQCCTLLPVNSATCERGFSTQNRIKSRLRTNLNNNSVNDLMRISEDGPSIENFDFAKALKIWKDEKKRKLFQS